MDMTTIGLTTLILLRMPEEITVNGQKAKAERDEDCDGDWIDYWGPSSDWNICIWMNGTDASVRASVFGDEIDTAVIDIRQDNDLTAVIAELCGEIEEELAKGE